MEIQKKEKNQNLYLLKKKKALFFSFVFCFWKNKRKPNDFKYLGGLDAIYYSYLLLSLGMEGIPGRKKVMCAFCSCWNSLVVLLAVQYGLEQH